MITFIDRYRAALGVESICRTMQLAPSAYYERKRQSIELAQRSLRQKTDESLRGPYVAYGKTISESSAHARLGAISGGKATTWPAAPLSVLCGKWASRAS